MRTRSLVLFAAMLFASTGCKNSAGVPPTDRRLAMMQLDGDLGARLTVTSSAFRSGTAIPPKYTADGGNVSPSLQWSDAPPTTKEFVLIVEDPDAPTPMPFVHWVAFRIPAGATALPEGSGGNALVGQGANDAGKTGYFGPKPPPGKPHRYFVQLYSLSAPLRLEDGATRDQVIEAMKGKVNGVGLLVGTFQTTK